MLCGRISLQIGETLQKVRREVNVPDENAPGVADQAEEHQKTNEYIEQQQAQVTQPPVD